MIELMSRRLDRMFESADALLLGLSERSRNAEEQRRYFDTKYLVRQHRQALTRVFKDELVAGFLPGAENRKQPANSDISFDELRMAKTRTIDESIAVNNIAIRAESSNEDTLREIGRRLDWLIQERGAAASPLAVAPATVCNAFRVSTQSLNLDFQQELVIYKLFDQLVAASLGEVYAEALKLLERGGVTAAVLKAAPRPALPPRPQDGGRRPEAHGAPGAQPAASGPPAGAGQIPDWATATTGFIAQTTGFGPAATPNFSAMPGTGAAPGRTGQQVARAGAPATTGTMPTLDPRTLQALRSAQGSLAAIPENYGDADLATELSQVASGQAVAGWSPVQARANIQCADLVGRMFNGIIEDPHVPQVLKPQLDELRFEVIKHAMTDRSFFSNAGHPIRTLINELATMAAAARTTGAGSVGQLANLAAMIKAQFQVAARAVRAAAATAAPVTDTDAERFLDDQLVQSKARRQALIDKARQVVREVLQLRLLDRTIPEVAQPMLLSGLSPLLGLQLLRTGMDSEGWRQGIALLEEVVDALDPRPGTMPDAAANAQLCAEIERELLAAGMLAPRATELMAGLRQGLEAAGHQPAAEAARPPPSPPPESPTALLLRLLVPGDWFKVHDAERQQTRWLKVAGHYLEDSRPEYRGRVAFAEFSGQNTLLVKVEDLLDHMAAGLTEPFDQSPAARATLADLVRQQQARLAQSPDFPA